MTLYERTFENETRVIAQQLYEGSGRVEGRDLDNWLEAERIAIARYREELLHKPGYYDWDEMPFEWAEC